MKRKAAWVELRPGAGYKKMIKSASGEWIPFHPAIDLEDDPETDGLDLMEAACPMTLLGVAHSDWEPVRESEWAPRFGDDLLPEVWEVAEAQDEVDEDEYEPVLDDSGEPDLDGGSLMLRYNDWFGSGLRRSRDEIIHWKHETVWRRQVARTPRNRVMVDVRWVAQDRWVPYMNVNGQLVRVER